MSTQNLVSLNTLETPRAQAFMRGVRPLTQPILNIERIKTSGLEVK